MCGIAGILAEKAEHLTSEIARMAKYLRHRGPDDGRCQTLPGCALGHRRLSIIDLAGGAQPMSDASGRYWIVFNGEIYNYRELRRTLEQRGAHFRTRSDTEVILQTYAHYGEDTPKYLNGQFAFLLWDTAERTAFAARDRLGEKPAAHGEFLCASEIKALLASGLLTPCLDRAAVDVYLALWYVPPDRTIYSNVHTLRPGHAFTWRDGRVRQWEYWTPAYSTQHDITLAEAITRIRELAAQAVRRQMVADVPVGAFLSGGLDSSTIVALMAQHTDRPLTFSVGFGDLINELPYARAVAETYRTAHHEMQMDITVGDMLERMAEVYDEPFADSSNIPTYLISQFACRFVKVVLSGDGGDELFGGYEWYRWLYPDDQKDGTLPTAAAYAWALALRSLARALPALHTAAHRASLRVRLGRARQRYPDVWDRHLALATSLRVDRTRLWGGRPPEEAEKELQAVYAPAAAIEDMDRATDFDVRCYLPGDILVKVDRAAMAHGLESRAPFLDVDLVEFVWSLPWRLRFRDGQLKWLLREACGDLWPSALRKRPKQGFGAPIENWIRRPDVRCLLDRVSAPNSALLTLLPGAAAVLNKTWPQQAWTLLCLGLWLEKHPAGLHPVST